MPHNSLLSLLVAVAMGGGAAVLARNWMQDRIAAVESERRGGVSVVVAAADIPFGKKIEPADVALSPWPRYSVPEGAFTDPALAVGKIANQRLVRGEPVLQARTAQYGAGHSLASQLETDRRAVAVRVNDVAGVAGFLLPGNHVDVLATRMLDNRKAQTRTIIRNVKVLAVDQTVQPDKDKPVVVRAVTLEVTPQHAEQLVQATEEGTVQLALLNPEDPTVVARSGAPEPAPAEPVKASVPKSAPRRSWTAVAQPSVTVIRQTQVGQTPTQ